MKPERERLICCLVGWHSAKDNTINGADLRILIDQHLIENNEPPLGKDDNDLLQDLLDETIWSIFSAHINRKSRRQKH